MGAFPWWSPWCDLVRRKVVVNVDTGQAFEGILWKRSGPLLILRNTTLHERGAQPQPIDGEVVVERHHVEFIQVLN